LTNIEVKSFNSPECAHNKANLSEKKITKNNLNGVIKHAYKLKHIKNVTKESEYKEVSFHLIKHIVNHTSVHLQE
jgi:hypothetical protein